MTPEQELEALRARLAELENTMPAVANVIGLGFAPVAAPQPLKRPFEYDRQLCRAIDMSRVKDSFKELVESICFNVTTKQYNRASPKQRLILLRTLAGQSKVKVDFKSTDETTYLQALVDAGILE